MLSQFTKEIPSHVTLADLSYAFEKDVYPVGRLDRDSEGLLILSNNSQINKQLLSPKNKQPKTYRVQVEGAPANTELDPLRQGIPLRIKKKEFTTLPATLQILSDDSEKQLPERNPPIRERKNIPDTWIEITIVEGKNRQVRKMFAAIGFPVLRLVRTKLAGFTYGEPPLNEMQPGEVKEITGLQL